MFARQRPWTHEHSDNNRRMSNRNRRPSTDSIEHKPARRQQHGVAAFKHRFRRVMLFAAFCGVIYLLFSFTKRGDAARLTWQKEPKWHESWYLLFFCRLIKSSLSRICNAAPCTIFRRYQASDSVDTQDR